MTLNWISIG
jgi:hypothetical protein